MSEKSNITRRSSLKSLGVLGAAGLFGAELQADDAPAISDLAGRGGGLRATIADKVEATPLIDTHEHLCEEQDRLPQGGKRPAGPDDWCLLLAGYLGSDLRSAGMPGDAYQKFFSRGPTAREKWALLEPYWLAVKNTGYGQAARLSMRALYGVEDLSADTVDAVQAGYERTRRPGFYKHILRDLCRIESCQVNSSRPPFIESAQPDLLMQDISIVGMFAGPQFDTFGPPTGIELKTLDDWYAVIDWWLERYAKYAVAVKSQNAYSRDIDYAPVPREAIEGHFQKRLNGQGLIEEDRKALEDHLFWYAVNRATKHDLPVKLHTGYYAGDNRMPLSRLAHNASSACDLCRQSPDTTFVLMHLCYPYYEELISVAKHYTNAYVDMCWGWIINPIAAKDFLKKYLVTAPANKIVTFGADYRNVEQVPGHAIIARQGIAQALSELVEESWMSEDDALELVDPIMHGNARRIFQLEKKQKSLRTAPWRV